MAIFAIILSSALSLIIGFLLGKMPEKQQSVTEDNPKLRKQWEEFLNYKGGQ
ncbi:MAG: hypothetical protein IKU25_03290 [Clostridia bacterium]|nr:hypothetical protein [Clostridia bacterium]